MARQSGALRFDRPLLMIQSDDWGRIGIRDRHAFERLQAAGVPLGTDAYDFYSLETASDVSALHEVLASHRDSCGRSPRIVMNFVTANLDFDRMKACGNARVLLRDLEQGLPGQWHRPGLLSAYRAGIEQAVFQPALHGSTHFCLQAVERELALADRRADLLHTLWDLETPYLYSHMPWVGFEYWDPNLPPSRRQLPLADQIRLIQPSVEKLGKLFGKPPVSACAPGYRADANTQRAWTAADIRLAQNGPAGFTPPHVSGDLLHTHRNLEFEPATDSSFSVERCLQAASQCFARGVPAIVSMHSINLHSTLRDFRSRTISALDRFLSAIEAAFRDVLYVNDAELLAILDSGKLEGSARSVRVSRTSRPAMAAS